MENKEYIVYLIINQDLKMSKGKIASQSAHVMHNFTQDLENKGDIVGNLIFLPNEYIEWIETSTRKIITLKANQEQINQLVEEGFYFTKDAGFTEVKEGSITAICNIMTKEEKDNHDVLGKLKLL